MAEAFRECFPPGDSDRGPRCPPGNPAQVTGDRGKMSGNTTDAT